ncbi:MAG: dicarboxylate/amino acid:cation symporter [Candidatus Krumholzibacteriia bacterium]
MTTPPPPSPPPSAVPRRQRLLRPWRWSLHWQILLGLLLGVAAGIVWEPQAVILGAVRPHAVFEFLGQTFLRALRMVIVPLIVGSIISGVAGVGTSRGIGRMFGKTFGWYVTTSLLAIVTGLVLVNIIQPGRAGDRAVGAELGFEATRRDVATELQAGDAGDLIGVLQRMIPVNPVEAAASGEMLPLIFFSLLYGLGLTLVSEAHRRAQLPWFEALFAVMMRITGWVIAVAPIGIFGLVAGIVSTSGFAAFAPLARYAGTVLGALTIHALVVLPLLVRLIGGVSPLRHARVMAPALLTAFSTRSSSATLPLTIARLEQGAGVSNRVSSFVLPLGATINMDGTALYECVAALFIAQAYGVELGVAAQFTVVITALLASIGAAGIPAAGLVMITIVLDAVGLPLEGVALILAVDPVLDMFRTTVNVWSDSCGAVVVARSEGEEDILRPSPPTRSPARS